MIIDAHLHLPAVSKRFTFEKAKRKLLSDMKKSKVDYAILIPDNLHNSSIGDLDMCLKLIENEKKLFLLGTIDIRKEGKKWIDKLDYLLEKGKIKGIKIFPGHDPIYPTDKRLTPVYKLCIKQDCPIVIHTGWNSNHPEAAKYNDPKYIIKIAKKFPKLKIVISHYFWPEIEYCYKITRGFKNIYFDTSALADKEVVEKTDLGKIKRFLELSMKDNSKSVLFGTDYPMCNFKAHIDLINSLGGFERKQGKNFLEKCRRIV
jgi:predicted TIM-barrel fold metal-dependent hydrolase